MGCPGGGGGGGELVSHPIYPPGSAPCMLGLFLPTTFEVGSIKREGFFKTRVGNVSVKDCRQFNITVNVVFSSPYLCNLQ